MVTESKRKCKVVDPKKVDFLVVEFEQGGSVTNKANRCGFNYGRLGEYLGLLVSHFEG